MFWEFDPNRFRFKMEPHEPVWKSVTTNLHRISMNILSVFFKNVIYGAQISDFPYFRPSYCQINVFLGLVEIGHVSRFTDLFTKLKNVDYFCKADSGRKLIIYTLRSIWYYVYIRNWQNQNNLICLYYIAYCIAY